MLQMSQALQSDALWKGNRCYQLPNFAGVAEFAPLAAEHVVAAVVPEALKTVVAEV